MEEQRDVDAAARLADAAERLKARAQRPVAGERDELAGLAGARLEVRRARARLAELEADLRAVLDGREVR